MGVRTQAIKQSEKQKDSYLTRTPFRTPHLTSGLFFRSPEMKKAPKTGASSKRAVGDIEKTSRIRVNCFLWFLLLAEELKAEFREYLRVHASRTYSQARHQIH